VASDRLGGAVFPVDVHMDLVQALATCLVSKVALDPFLPVTVEHLVRMNPAEAQHLVHKDQVLEQGF
jgi:hypothetical protein